MPDRVPYQDRLWFALGSYNISLGYLNDARKITETQQQFSTHEYPFQDGSAENYIMTITNKTICNLQAAELHKHFCCIY